MTPAEHAALSAQLARSIGWGHVHFERDVCKVGEPWMPELGIKFAHILNWRAFDYRDPSVALPVLEWLMREHEAKADADNLWFWVCCGSNVAYGDTLPEAIARAAIAVMEGK